jgi:hypothetical protein
MSRSPQCPRWLRPALAATFVLVLLPCSPAHAVEVQGAGLRLPGLGEIFSPLMDLVFQLWGKTGGGLDPDGSPRGEEGGGLDPDGAPAAGSSETGSGLDPSGSR